MDEKFQKDLAATEQQGKTRFGEENWVTMMDALRRASPEGIPEAQMREVLKTGNAADLLFNAGRHRLMDEASGGDKQAEMTYSKIRNAERKAWREFKGRG